MRTVAEQWASYEREVLPPTAGATQRIESRRAFFAGAQAFLGLMAQVQADDISDDQGAEMIERLSQELQAFGEAVKAGLA